MLLFLSLLLLPEFRPHGRGPSGVTRDSALARTPLSFLLQRVLHTTLNCTRAPSSLDWKPHRILSCLSPNTWGPWDAPSSVPRSPLSPTTLRHCAADSLHPRHTHVCYQHIPFGSCGCSGLECCLLLWQTLDPQASGTLVSQLW